MDKLSNDELIAIFNEALQKYTHKPFRKYLDSEHKTQKQTYRLLIECNLTVFETIPKSDIKMIMTDFCNNLFDYVIHKYYIYQKINTIDRKKTKNKIQSDINTIQKYQTLIEHYIKPNTDQYTPILDEVYQLNIKAINTLKTHEISNFGWVSPFIDLTEYLASYNPTTKTRLKEFFEDLKSRYHIAYKPLFDII